MLRDWGSNPRMVDFFYFILFCLCFVIKIVFHFATFYLFTYYGAYSADAEIAQHERRGPLDLRRLPHNICGRQSY